MGSIQHAIIADNTIKLLLVADPDKWGKISFATGVDMSANIAKPQLYSFEKNT